LFQLALQTAEFILALLLEEPDTNPAFLYLKFEDSPMIANQHRDILWAFPPTQTLISSLDRNDC
jgi:hypothetical protein